jgi:prepilin-type N-terminal cleavage/methylation domain-containing protein
MSRTDSRGFTLVELLVVIGIIGLLSTMTIAAVNNARGKARIARAQGDVKQLATAIQLLAADTGKWPNGCPLENVADPEVDLSAATAGITQAPPVGQVSAAGGGKPECRWTASDVGKWNGPYMKSVVDPWGRSYLFDPDYQKPSCPGSSAGSEVPTVMSAGPTLSDGGSHVNDYDCDNIIYELR